MSKTYRAAVIGCGGISHLHARQYHDFEDVELVACSDINPDAMAGYEERYGVKKHYEDYGAMLAEEPLDLVSVCTWIPLHPVISLAAAKAGVKGIICEKPMATSMTVANEMVDVCDAHGAKLAIGHQLRFDGPYIGARQLLADGVIGDLVKIHGICEGGDLMDNGTHTVDLMRWFADDSPHEWVMGQISRGAGGTKFGIASLEDYVGYWKHENGVRAFIEGGKRSARGYHHIHLYGTEGEIELGAPGGPALRYRASSTAGHWATTSYENDSSPVRDMIDAIKEDRDHRSSGRNGRAALEILLGIMESARQRALIELPLSVDDYPLQSMIDAGDV
ncbi:Gfo/Idh/MocA family oxidoreductase [Candidatus Poribacteria bacterium]|jgi:UDP-N-acetylglucosamine 3-dehydrogenase|nr:Gfo/Idh/MocA family oxidoreductase [Candidatus Poribacteria bacterium]MBT5533257.1 Gfo/Idh/MocA family oxidoreductase [Candidatus Poribacteria bacterium]MBT5710179.1 Gfo/Idh/MocA family oxidoreductase [Candidatus Poribacteria bacterium]MBT7096452.1 Gfo/Idh/MocA family oxidoreductase [Candidatus Poribacteria bacterium]MBT7807604.1 Gfo/Idh/MocA family oxidoreductase [Candidatus Poribacteria bacterium]